MSFRVWFQHAARQLQRAYTSASFMPQISITPPTPPTHPIRRAPSTDHPGRKRLRRAKARPRARRKRPAQAPGASPRPRSAAKLPRTAGKEAAVPPRPAGGSSSRLVMPVPGSATTTTPTRMSPRQRRRRERLRGGSSSSSGSVGSTRPWRCVLDCFLLFISKRNGLWGVLSLEMFCCLWVGFWINGDE